MTAYLLPRTHGNIVLCLLVKKQILIHSALHSTAIYSNCPSYDISLTIKTVKEYIFSYYFRGQTLNILTEPSLFPLQNILDAV